MRLFLTRFVQLSRFTILCVDFNSTKYAVIAKMSNISRLGDTLESVLCHSVHRKMVAEKKTEIEEEVLKKFAANPRKLVFN